MHINKLTLTNFRRFEEIELAFDERLTVLIARNGAGKTSILDAIAIALGAFLTRLPKVSGLNPKSSDLRVFPDGRQPAYLRVRCEADNGVVWDRTERRDKSKKTTKEIPKGVGISALNGYVDSIVDAYNEGVPCILPVFIYYGTGRGVFDVPQRKKGFSQQFTQFEALRGALESRTNFKRFVEYFYYLEGKESAQQKEQRSFDVEIHELKAIRAAISRLMPEFSNPRKAYPAGIMVDWKVEEETRKLRIEQLSDGYRTTLAMVMDIAARMAEANPHLTDPLSSEGVILIDEVDLHLHPEWQREFLPKLINVFPNVQFIVTTHSPFIIQSVKKGKLLDLDQDDPEDSPMLNQELGVEDIVEKYMGVEDVHRSAEFVKQTEIADQYYRLLDEGKQLSDPEMLVLERQLDELEDHFADNPAYVALLRAERRKQLQ